VSIRRLRTAFPRKSHSVGHMTPNVSQPLQLHLTPKACFKELKGVASACPCSRGYSSFNLLNSRPALPSQGIRQWILSHSGNALRDVHTSQSCGIGKARQASCWRPQPKLSEDKSEIGLLCKILTFFQAELYIFQRMACTCACRCGICYGPILVQEAI
jgi:hypothetical protein